LDLDPKKKKKKKNEEIGWKMKKEKKAKVANVVHLSAICWPNLMGFVGLV
jgi:hypothetical protein